MNKFKKYIWYIITAIIAFAAGICLFLFQSDKERNSFLPLKVRSTVASTTKKINDLKKENARLEAYGDIAQDKIKIVQNKIKETEKQLEELKKKHNISSEEISIWLNSRYN